MYAVDVRRRRLYLSIFIPVYVPTTDRVRPARHTRHAMYMHVHTCARQYLAKVTTAKRVFSLENFTAAAVSNSPWSRRQFFSPPARPLVIHAPPAPSTPSRFILIAPGISFRRESAIPALEKGTRRIRVAISLAGCGGQGTAGADGYPGVGFLETRKGRERRRTRETRGGDERCEVRQVRVPYFPEIRGLLECRVSLAEAPETASRGCVCRWGLVTGRQGRRRADGFGYASPRLGWICRRHLLARMRNSPEKRGSRLVVLSPCFPLTPSLRNNFGSAM